MAPIVGPKPRALSISSAVTDERAPSLLDTLTNLEPHVKINHKTYQNGKVVANKTAEQRHLIEWSLHRNSLFTCLDEEQIQRYVKEARLLEFAPDEVIYGQGERGYDAFIVEEGEAEVIDVHDDGTLEPVSIKSRGSIFGDGSMIFHRRRSATLKAKSKMRCWVVDDRVFVENILQSTRIQKLFDKYASLTDSHGIKVMTMDDFVRSCNDTSVIDVIKYSQLRSLYRIVRGDQEFVYFKDFSLFNMFMTRPDPEYDIAFLLFDRQKHGYLTLQDVRSFLDQQVGDFNFDCDFIRRFFGTSGRKRIRVDDFSLFFNKLQNEMAQQAFMQLDPTGSGFVSLADFFKLLSNFGRRQLPDTVMRRIEQIKRGQDISFSDFIAYQTILNNLPSLCTTITTSAEIKEGPLSKDDFKVATRVLNRRFSRVESDIVFELFDLDRDGYISAENCRDILGGAYIKELRGIIGRGGSVTFAPPPGYTLERRSSHVLAGGRRDSDVARHAAPVTFLERLTNFVEHFLLGAVAGGIGAFAVYPLDLVKTRMQNQRSGKADAVAKMTGGAVLQYKGNLDCFRQVFAREGILGFYGGLLPQLIGVAPEKAIKLAVNDLLRDMFTNRDKGTGQHKIYFPLEVLAGCGAGASQVVFTNPLEIVKIRLQVQGETALMMNAAGHTAVKPRTAAQIVAELGLVGLYKGASACFLRDIPFSGIYFPAYAAAKRWLAGENGQLKAHHLLIAGALAGVPAASLTTPADVIKTRLQVKPRAGEMTYEGITDCTIKIYQNEGMGAFFKGALMRVMRSSPQFGVTLLSYEGLRSVFASNLEPRPPTNAPVSATDYDAFRKDHISLMADHVSNIVNFRGHR